LPVRNHDRNASCAAPRKSRREEAIWFTPGRSRNPAHATRPAINIFELERRTITRSDAPHGWAISSVLDWDTAVRHCAAQLRDVAAVLDDREVQVEYHEPDRRPDRYPTPVPGIVRASLQLYILAIDIRDDYSGPGYGSL